MDKNRLSGTYILYDTVNSGWSKNDVCPLSSSKGCTDALAHE